MEVGIIISVAGLGLTVMAAGSGAIWSYSRLTKTVESNRELYLSKFDAIEVRLNKINSGFLHHTEAIADTKERLASIETLTTFCPVKAMVHEHKAQASPAKAATT